MILPASAGQSFRLYAPPIDRDRIDAAGAGGAMRIALAASALRPAHPSRCRDRLTWLGQSGSLTVGALAPFRNRRLSRASRPFPQRQSPGRAGGLRDPTGRSPRQRTRTARASKPRRHPAPAVPRLRTSILALSRARRRAIFRACGSREPISTRHPELVSGSIPPLALRWPKTRFGAAGWSTEAAGPAAR